MIDWARVEANDTSEPVQVKRGGGSSDLSSEPMTSNSGHSDLMIVHESNDVLRDVVHVERIMMI